MKWPSSSFSLLDTLLLSDRDILNLFEKADHFDPLAGRLPESEKRVVACIFFEPSTRTRLSFQMATYRLGHQVLAAEMNENTSVSKGETLTDTVLNIAAMKPDALVIRYGKSQELDALLPTLPMPVISAGSGVSAHPTQALLDAYTIHKARGHVLGSKVLIVGDIKHSRVASSNFDVLTKLGAEIGVCGPSEFLSDVKLPKNAKIFSDLGEAVAWCDVYMGLRIQLERHANASGKPSSDYQDRFGLNSARLRILKKDAIIMHPGPINHGVEFSHEVFADPRSHVLKQVANGVLIRAAVLAKALERDV